MESPVSHAKRANVCLIPVILDPVRFQIEKSNTMTTHPQITTATRSLRNYLINVTALLPVCRLRLARTVVAGLLIATGSVPVHAQSTSSATPVRSQTNPSSAADVEPTKATPDEETIRMGEFVVTSAAPLLYQAGNMDLPRTSDDVQPYTIINQTAIQQSNRADLENFLKDEITTDLSLRIANVCTTL